MVVCGTKFGKASGHRDAYKLHGKGLVLNDTRMMQLLLPLILIFMEREALTCFFVPTSKLNNFNICEGFDFKFSRYLMKMLPCFVSFKYHVPSVG